MNVSFRHISHLDITWKLMYTAFPSEGNIVAGAAIWESKFAGRQLLCLQP